MQRRACLAYFALTLFAVPGLWCSVPDCCGHCGQERQLTKVCRVVWDEEEVKTPKYTVECEDFCVLGKSQKCGCTLVPTCGCVRTRKKLLKTQEVKKTPKARCVVEFLCTECRQQTGPQEK